MSLFCEEFAPLFQSARVFANYIILFMLSFRAVISYYLISFGPIAALQVAAIKMFHFYSSPVPLGQINFVLVLLSTNHNGRYLYPEMDISRTAYGFIYAFSFGVFSVFCSRDLAITPSATPHPWFKFLHEGTWKFWGKNTDKRRGVGPKLFHHSNRACNWIRCQRTA